VARFAHAPDGAHERVARVRPRRQLPPARKGPASGGGVVRDARGAPGGADRGAARLSDGEPSRRLATTADRARRGVAGALGRRRARRPRAGGAQPSRASGEPRAVEAARDRGLHRRRNGCPTRIAAWTRGVLESANDPGAERARRRGRAAADRHDGTDGGHASGGHLRARGQPARPRRGRSHQGRRGALDRRHATPGRDVRPLHADQWRGVQPRRPAARRRGDRRCRQRLPHAGT